MGADVGRKKNAQKSNWIIDAVLFVGLLVACVLDLTGLALHEWLGLVVVVFAAYHLLVHWKWVDAVSRRFFGKTSGEARLYYVIDVGLAVGFAGILVTGLVISTWLDLALENYLVWRDAHIVASIATVGLTVAKIGYHWKWIVQVARRSIFRAAAPPTPRLDTRPVAVATSRRDFLRLMGGVSALALVATRPGLETWLGSKTGPLEAAADGPAQPPTAAALAPEATATSAPPTATSVSPTATAAAPRATTVAASVTAAPSATRAAPAATATPAAAAVTPATTCTVRCPRAARIRGSAASTRT